jgi:hypothetical protein
LSANAGSSGDLPTPPCQDEKARASQEQARQSRTGDGARNVKGAKQPVHLAIDTIGEEEGIGASSDGAPGPEAEEPKATWRVASANVDRNGAFEYPG